MNDIVNTWIFKINEYIVNFSSFFPLRFIISPLHTQKHLLTNKNTCYGSNVLELFNIINSLRYLKFPMHFADLICSSEVKYQ